MLVQASSLSLLPPSLSSSTKPLSLLFEPNSQSLAVTLTNSSILLFASFSPSSPSPPLSIPQISTSACFVLLNPNPSPGSSRPLFVSASPSPSSSSTLLRAWIRRSKSDLFAPASLSFKKRTGRRSNEVDLGLRHGIGVRVAGSVNVLVVHSVAESQIWVLGVRVVGGEGGERVELEKCAVVECTRPIYEIRVSMGVLALGEVGGVRVFPLRPMVKGEQGLKKKRRDLSGAGEPQNRGKLRTLKLRQDSGNFSSFFVMTSAVAQDSECSTGLQASLKAIAIRILSQKKFLILDSVGNIYLLSLRNVLALETISSSSTISTADQLNHLDVTMNVQLLAVLPDISANGAHTIHVMSMADVDHSVKEADENGNKEKEMKITAIRVIFTSEKVQDIVPLSANAIMVLGQGSIFSYSIA
ncbi:uncharacterized protein LOC109831955 isoform X2 [Asparagus officinalis]|uniref:uncharacterized protein LOC109831955 isoform X2 n=1 Tax=Asparagus officinalis TaxID=4686 RepID=UPI00098E7FAC|nr:uncharacterized protein LOC109831955 isoform X2 [Asparagus officinalis]